MIFERLQQDLFHLVPLEPVDRSFLVDGLGLEVRQARFALGSPLAAISTEITERSRRSLGSLDTVHKAWAFH